jgi:hypothetical protein
VQSPKKVDLSCSDQHAGKAPITISISIDLIYLVQKSFPGWSLVRTVLQLMRQKHFSENSNVIQMQPQPQEDEMRQDVYGMSRSGGGAHTWSTRHVDHFWPIVPAPGDAKDGEFGGMKIGKGHRSSR